jgi:hypothetical protein
MKIIEKDWNRRFKKFLKKAVKNQLIMPTILEHKFIQKNTINHLVKINRSRSYQKMQKTSITRSKIQ